MREGLRESGGVLSVNADDLLLECCGGLLGLAEALVDVELGMLLVPFPAVTFPDPLLLLASEVFFVISSPADVWCGGSSFGNLTFFVLLSPFS